MEATKPTIWLIEDEEKFQKNFSVAIETAAGDSFEIKLITKKEMKKLDCPKRHKAIEDRLGEYLDENSSSIALLVVDHDLSALRGGLSSSAFRLVSKKLFVPLARYHKKPDGEKSRWFNELTENVSTLLKIGVRVDEFAEQVVELARGFLMIKEELKQISQKDRGKGLAYILSRVLGGSTRETLYFEAYAEGANFIPIRSLQNDEQVDCMLAYFLGNWLVNVIFKYPGVILNQVATASYLNISLEKFQEHQIQEFFENAKYIGPFNHFNGPYWWKDKLDDITEDLDGKEFLERKDITVDFCHCEENKELEAGYFDLLKERPISETMASARLNWIPRGADLARVNKKEFEQLAPMLGIF